MKKHLLILLLALTSFSLQAQNEMRVVGKGEFLPSELIDKTVRDANGETCAGLMISTDLVGLTYTSYNNIVKVNKNPGKDLIFLSPEERVVEVYCSGFSSLKIMLNDFGINLKSGQVWQLKITGNSNYSRSDDNLIELQFLCSEENVYSSYKSLTPTLSLSKTISYKLPKGTYTFKFQKNGFADVTKAVDLQTQQQLAIQLEKGGVTKKFALPGIIHITSEPSNAEILINGQKMGNTPKQAELSSGTHQLEIRKPLYYSDLSSFVLDEGKTVSLQRTLKPKFGMLSAASTVQGSKLFLDDKYIDTLPVNNLQLESSFHKVKIEAPFYHPYSEEFQIKDGDTKVITAVMKPAFGSFEITSSPETGAEVFLDGRRVGVTPYTQAQLASGKYLLRVTKNLFSDTEEYIEIQDGQSFTKNILLNKNFAELEISAPESRISIDGNYAATNEYVSRLAPGQHVIKVERSEKYHPKEETVFLSVGDKKKIVLEPEPKLGSVSVFAEPNDASDAAIYVEGELKGSAPLVLPLLIGQYKLTARKSNYLDVSETVTVEENTKKSVTFSMLTYEGSRLQLANTWGTVKWISAGATLLCGGTAAYFHFSSQSNYDKYKAATTTADALAYKKKTEDHKRFANMFIYTATATASAALISWIIQTAL
ncbi:MAG: hypothetical protein COW85_07575 [Ignavibacteria bacterium CG22_combo_CG10-13_8_21_14_all_37_15]|nr:MAG: hypothetical protein COW85_07575 [Ignavibacteria bacterium CG22_combo_CG10-13_8_21_14_all_37_15]